MAKKRSPVKKGSAMKAKKPMRAAAKKAAARKSAPKKKAAAKKKAAPKKKAAMKKMAKKKAAMKKAAMRKPARRGGKAATKKAAPKKSAMKRAPMKKAAAPKKKAAMKQPMGRSNRPAPKKKAAPKEPTMKPVSTRDWPEPLQNDVKVDVGTKKDNEGDASKAEQKVHPVRSFMRQVQEAKPNELHPGQTAEHGQSNDRPGSQLERERHQQPNGNITNSGSARSTQYKGQRRDTE
jgi:hypothetical protein